MLPYNEAQISDSDKKVDIHILVVPSSQWKTDLRNTHLSTCANSVSAGFVRVYPDISLAGLKAEISKQLDGSLLPENYTLLRNVGHLLTWVSPKQEATLKVRLFLPPLAPCPEIYVLDSKCLQNMADLPPVKSSKFKPRTRTEGCNCNSYCVGPCSTSTPYYCATQFSHPHPAIHWRVCHHDNHSPMHTASLCSHPSPGYPTPEYTPSNYSSSQQHSNKGYSKQGQGIDARNSSLLPNDSGLLSEGRANARGRTKTYPGDITQQNSPLLADTNSNGKTLTGRYAAPGPSGRHVEGGPGVHSPFDNTEQDPKKMGYAKRKFKNDSSSRYRQNGSGLSNADSSTLQAVSSVFHPSAGTSQQTRTNRYTQGSKGQGYSRTMQQPSPLPTKQTRGQPTQNAVPNTKNDSTHEQRLAIKFNDGGAHETARYRSTEVYVQPPSSHTDYRSPGFGHLQSEGDTQDSGGYSSKYTSPFSGPERASVDTAYGGMSEENSSSESEQSDYSTDGESQEHTPQRSGNKPEKLTTTQRKADRVDFLNPVNGSNTSNKSGLLDPNRANTQRQSPSKVVTIQQPEGLNKQSNEQKVNRGGVGKRGKRPRMVRQARITSASEPGVPTGRVRNPRKGKNTYPPPSKLRQPQVKTNRNGVSMGTTRRIFSRENNSKTANNDKNGRDFADLASVPALPPIAVTERPVRDAGNVDLTSMVKKPQASSVEPTRVTRPSTAQTNHLLGEIRKLKEECDELTSLKGQLSSALRSIQLLARTHREEYNNEWKRNYFQEKKTSTLLEEKVQKRRTDCQKLENEIDKTQVKLYKGAIQKSNYNPQVEPPSESSNVKIQCRRHKRDIEHLKSRLDTVRLRLSAERKARNATVNECKTLREEVLRKKISRSRRKTKQQIEVTT